MYEKGNKIVYELDQANRSLKLLKDNIHLMETRIAKEIDSQYRNKLKHREAMLDNNKQKFRQFKEGFKKDFEAGITAHEAETLKLIKKRKEQFQDVNELSPAKY